VTDSSPAASTAAAEPGSTPARLGFKGVTHVRDGRAILADIDWTVRAGERWVVLGPNGAGKTTLLSLAAARQVPTRGYLEILGAEVGAVDIREIRPHIGLVSRQLAAAFPRGVSALDVVVTGADASLRLWRQEFTTDVLSRARELLELVDCAPLADHRFETMSDGERLRVLIARALLPRPELLVLDEPAANLDLAGLEQLLRVLDRLPTTHADASLVLVTHRLEEIPTTMTHALLLSEGRIVTTGLIDDVVASEPMSQAFAVPVTITRMDGRFIAR
jgi:iron complex transport system ATP-binding protein